MSATILDSVPYGEFWEGAFSYWEVWELHVGIVVAIKPYSFYVFFFCFEKHEALFHGEINCVKMCRFSYIHFVPSKLYLMIQILLHG